MVYNIYVLLVTIILIVVSTLIPNINVLSANSWCFCLCFSVHLFTELSLLVLSLRMLKFYSFEIFFIVLRYLDYGLGSYKVPGLCFLSLWT